MCTLYYPGPLPSYLSCLLWELSGFWDFYSEGEHQELRVWLCAACWAASVCLSEQRRRDAGVLTGRGSAAEPPGMRSGWVRLRSLCGCTARFGSDRVNRRWDNRPQPQPQILGKYSNNWSIIRPLTATGCWSHILCARVRVLYARTHWMYTFVYM